MTRQGLNSPASSIDSSSRPSLSSSSSISNKPIATRSSSKTDLTADLRLGLGISASQQSHHQVQDIYFTTARLTMATEGREQYNDCDWLPIKALLRRSSSTLASDHHNNQTLFVKVYMEGIPIGRKLDLLAHEGYQHLIQTLTFMFRTTIILHPDLAAAAAAAAALHEVPSSETHVLTYEDKDGDWMLVGDVPWEMFLTNVKRLKIISRANKC